jgi:hypothetical protein
MNPLLAYIAATSCYRGWWGLFSPLLSSCF